MSPVIELLNKIEKSHSKSCDVCGSLVIPHSSSDGTSFYEPVIDAETLKKLIAALRVAVESLQEFQLGHEHAAGLSHTRSMGDNYGWCDYCQSKVDWGLCDAEKALNQIREIFEVPR